MTSKNLCSGNSKRRAKFWLLGSILSVSFSAFVVGYSYRETRSEILFTAQSRIVSTAQPMDALKATQVLYQMICESRTLSDCSIEAFQDGVMLASVPTVVSPKWLRIDQEKFELNSFAPSVHVVASFNPSRPFVVRSCVISAVLALLVFSVLAFLEARWLSMQKEKEFIRISGQAQLGELAAKIAHDIRSPLSALRVVVGITDDMNLEKASLMRSAIERIDHIAQELLRTSRRSGQDLRNSLIESTIHDAPMAIESENQMKFTQVISLIEEVIQQKKLELHQLNKNIRFTVHHLLQGDQGSVGTVIEKNHFFRIISNLLNNSVEAIDQNGFVSVDVTETDSNLVITIRDNGRGIPAEKMNDLFLRGATWGKPEGNGLGLYYAKDAIQKWGGMISLTSELGRGTVVQIDLPAVVGN